MNLKTDRKFFLELSEAELLGLVKELDYLLEYARTDRPASQLETLLSLLESKV